MSGKCLQILLQFGSFKAVHNCCLFKMAHLFLLLQLVLFLIQRLSFASFVSKNGKPSATKKTDRAFRSKCWVWLPSVFSRLLHFNYFPHFSFSLHNRWKIPFYNFLFPRVATAKIPQKIEKMNFLLSCR